MDCIPVKFVITSLIYQKLYYWLGIAVMRRARALFSTYRPLPEMVWGRFFFETLKYRIGKIKNLENQESDPNAFWLRHLIPQAVPRQMGGLGRAPHRRRLPFKRTLARYFKIYRGPNYKHQRPQELVFVCAPQISQSWITICFLGKFDTIKLRKSQ